MIPEPTTVARRNAVPMPSTTTRRGREADAAHRFPSPSIYDFAQQAVWASRDSSSMSSSTV
jgi:hypothetical protein